jgi:hypothetical protein
VNPDTLEPIVEAILAAHPEGLNEQKLLQQLRAHPDSGMAAERAITGLGLFRSHFLLFHTLYRLRDRRRQRGTGDLVIDPMCIRLRRYQPDGPGVGPYDHLRAYYLDRENLEQIDEADVAAMLSGFDAELRNREHRAWAMAELGLTEPFDEASARREYRRLAMRHHPDRGGDAERLKTINEALKTLLPEDGNKA